MLVASTAVDGPAQYIGMLVAVIVGALSGESIGFALGRFFGPKIRDSRLGRRIGITNWHRAEYYVDRRGGIAVFVSRFLPVLHSLVPVTVGMSTMSYRRFIAWTAPACVIWAVAYVTVGSVVGGRVPRSCGSSCTSRGTCSSASIVVVRGRRRRREEAASSAPRRGTGRSPATGTRTRRRNDKRGGRRSARPLSMQISRGSRCPAATRWRCRPTTSAGRRSRRSSRRDPRGSAQR